MKIFSSFMILLSLFQVSSFNIKSTKMKNMYMHREILHMSCDYYTYKYLDIKISNGDDGYIELSCDKGWLMPGSHIDEDVENYDEKIKAYYDAQLESYFEPITIYENNSFINKRMKEKYIELIEEYCRDNKIKKSKIIKIEKNEYKEYSS